MTLTTPVPAEDAMSGPDVTVDPSSAPETVLPPVSPKAAPTPPRIDPRFPNVLTLAAPSGIDNSVITLQLD